MIDPDRHERFGALLRGYRTALGLSQNAVARAARMDPAYINRLEHGRQAGQPTRKALYRIAQALRLNPAETDRLLHAGGTATVTDWQAEYERLETALRHAWATTTATLRETDD